MRWVWSRLVFIIIYHDWQLGALLLSMFGATRGVVLMAPIASLGTGAENTVLCALSISFSALLFCGVLRDDALWAKISLFALSMIWGYHAYSIFLSADPTLYIAAAAMSGVLSTTCGIAFLSASRPHRSTQQWTGR